MTRAILLAVLAIAAACDEPSFPPEACGTLQDTDVFIGQQELVSLCFQDPDGDAVRRDCHRNGLGTKTACPANRQHNVFNVSGVETRAGKCVRDAPAIPGK